MTIGVVESANNTLYQPTKEEFGIAISEILQEQQENATFQSVKNILQSRNTLWNISDRRIQKFLKRQSSVGGYEGASVLTTNTTNDTDSINTTATMATTLSSTSTISTALSFGEDRSRRPYKKKSKYQPSSGELEEAISEILDEWVAQKEDKRLPTSQVVIHLLKERRNESHTKWSIPERRVLKFLKRQSLLTTIDDETALPLPPPVSPSRTDANDTHSFVTVSSMGRTVHSEDETNATFTPARGHWPQPLSIPEEVNVQMEETKDKNDDDDTNENGATATTSTITIAITSAANNKGHRSDTPPTLPNSQSQDSVEILTDTQTTLSNSHSQDSEELLPTTTDHQSDTPPTLLDSHSRDIVEIFPNRRGSNNNDKCRGCSCTIC